MTPAPGYLTSEQIGKLLQPIHPGRVHHDDKGFSHVQAYEIRAHLNRIFGFGRWSSDLTEYRLAYEDGRPRLKNDGSPMLDSKTSRPKIGWYVGYTATVRLQVRAPDGTLLATYTEAAAGAADNQPSQGDAHDLALKSAESQALKRCAANLGDQFGLSLYKQGSTNKIVSQVLVGHDGALRKADSGTGDDLQEAGVEPPQSDVDGAASIRTTGLYAGHNHAEYPQSAEEKR